MGHLIIHRRDNDTQRFHKALEMLEYAYNELSELTEKMEQQFGERGGMSSRYGERGYNERGYSERGTSADRDGDGRYNERGGYSAREWDRMEERQGRNSMGQYR